MFPLPFTWIFRDLSKFIFEPICVKIFRKYLEKEEKNKIEYLEQIMQIYIRSFQNSESSIKDKDISEIGTYLMNDEQQTSRAQFLDYIANLKPSFRRFKRTKAYQELYQKVKEFE